MVLRSLWANAAAWRLVAARTAPSTSECARRRLSPSPELAREPGRAKAKGALVTSRGSWYCRRVDRRTVELRIAGQSYRVVSSAPEEELQRLAQAVGAKLAEIVPKGRPMPAQAMLLAAIALAHDVEESRSERAALERRTRDLLRRTLVRIDDALEPVQGAEAARNE
jgi:cell division protein ZapA